MASITSDESVADVSDSSDTSCTSISTLDDSNVSIDSEACSQNIRVVARIRPLSTKEQKEQSKQVLIPNLSSNLIQIDQGRCFEFDRVFQASATQSEVYEQTAGDMIQNHLFKGFNVTVLAYGQTGSGKTHTIFGGNGNKFSSELNEELDGIIPRAVNELFQSIGRSTSGEDEIKVDMSFLEIYNEEAKDLLSNDNNHGDLSIRESSNGVVVKNLSRHSVVSPQEVAALMLSAAEKRSTASTLMNEVSSRSHAICTLYVTMSPLTKSEKDCAEKISAKLTLVDLAGSERIKKTGAEGMRLKEGININKGLFVLGQVVSALSELSQQVSSDSSSSTHVNYRDSKLTRLLQDSLGGNSKTVMVACVSPADSNIDESTNTLRYAERTRSIKNSAVRNVVAASLSPSEAAALRKENQMLKLKLVQAQTKLSSESSKVDISNTTQNIIKLLSTKSVDSATPSFAQEEINGLGVRELDIVTKLMLHCSAMEEKVNQLEKKSKSVMEDSFEASLKADRWQLKYESLVSQMKDKDVSIPETKTVIEEDNMQMLSVVENLRKEVLKLKDELREAGIDAEVSRATAAAVLNGKGDLKVAETIAMVNNTSNEESIQDFDSNLSAELVAMSGSIERKENMIRSANQERDCLETLRSHFEGALKALQDEVQVLSSEKEGLQHQISNPKYKKSDTQIKGLKNKISQLENRMKDLKQKESEHKKALRLREQAEKKIQKLEAEIEHDKKRKAELQRKLKEGNIERRNERKEARLNAVKYLRDSTRIQRELTKVKESAAKQESVLRRKAEEALRKQKRMEEQTKKRPHTSSYKSDISSERKEEIKSWINSEVNERARVPSKSSHFVDSSFWQTLDQSELRHVSQILFQRAVGNANDSVKRTSKKKKKKKEDAIVIEPIEPVFFDYGGDDDEVLNEDSDSDWSPDTPAPRKKLRKTKNTSDASSVESGGNVIDEENPDFYKNMTVNKLRELLRQSGLTVSGKKADLIKRLQYSARAKKALVSTQTTETANESTSSFDKTVPKNDDQKSIYNSTKKAIRKRPVSKQEGNINSSKKLKLCQETISSSLRKRSPINSTARSIASSSSTSSVTKKSPTLTKVSLQNSTKKKSPPHMPTRSSKHLSPPSSISKNVPIGNSSTLGRSTRSSTRRKPVRRSPTASSPNALRSVSIDENIVKSSQRKRSNDSMKSVPLSTITNSAKKRKSKRRASMKKSVNKALLQLEQLEQIL